MAEATFLKRVIWVGSSRHDLRGFPDDVQDYMGYALYVAQRGDKHRGAKVLTGFSGASVVEIVKDYRGDTFRAVYTVRYAGANMSFMPSRRSLRAEERRRAEIWN